ncbi:unnamed protein product [Ilex paraguariensis]|uniref:Uncharacterized protein n=1 Tax=Ilex paraguariensis TaxID=185542 RepID=A0ABC8R5C3_9AQUA
MSNTTFKPLTQNINHPEITKVRKFSQKPTTQKQTQILRTSKLGDGLSSLRNSMFSQLTRQNQPHSSLNLPRSNRGFLVIPREFRRLLSKLLENVIDEAVHNHHGLARNPNVRVDLLQNLEDVHLVCLRAPLHPLLFLISGSRCTTVFGQLLPALGFFSAAGAFSATMVFFSSAGFFSAGFFSALGAISDSFGGKRVHRERESFAEK